MEEKSWTIVSFIEDNSVEAVPSHWIQGGLCHWPSFAKDKLLYAIRKCEPLNTCWPTHRVKVFRNATFDDYGKARLKTITAEETSDLNTDREETKRKRIQKVLSSSESDLSDTILPSPPKQKKTRQDIKSSYSNVDETQSSTVQIDVIQGELIEKENQNVACTVCVEKDKYLKTLAEQVHIIRGVTVDIIAEVKEIKKQINSGNTQEQKVTFAMKFPNTYFPITSDEQFDSLEQLLNIEDDMQLLVEQISKIGGTNIYNFVKRVLSTLITNEMALKYSWLGRKGKKAFSKLNMAKLVIDAGERVGLVRNRSDAEVAIQTWLKRASDRKSSSINKKNA
ncbi:hypothetical protein RN001_002459 [Aquatica leii]|uniref:DUF4806 domain-containing protein n=1 Tax=Aquatica leii TaxID=1421715 RepID=A0AAN7QNI2_9COLE|nr:hypothetical protein RN001_002459 [Aquatica leii]